MITCTLENGHTHHFRHVTVDAIIIQDQKILLIKRNPSYHIEPGKYALPGGFLEMNETADQAITRETLEETGYRITSAKLFKIVHSPRLKGDDRQNVGFFYHAQVAPKPVQASDNEVSSVHWLPLKELKKVDIAFDHANQIISLIDTGQSQWPIIT